MNLLNQKCTVLEDGVKAMTKTEAESMVLEYVKDWTLDNEGINILKEFVFKNFKEVLSFVNKVGEIAENEQHHPDINIYDYKNVKITLSTHSIKGLSKNDFIMAVKIDNI